MDGCAAARRTAYLVLLRLPLQYAGVAADYQTNPQRSIGLDRGASVVLEVLHPPSAGSLWAFLHASMQTSPTNLCKQTSYLVLHDRPESMTFFRCRHGEGGQAL